jgi:hypothetical protein
LFFPKAAIAPAEHPLPPIAEGDEPLRPAKPPASCTTNSETSLISLINSIWSPFGDRMSCACSHCVQPFSTTPVGVPLPPHTSRAPGFATQDHSLVRDSIAAQGITQDMESTSAKRIKGGVPRLQRGPKAKPPRFTDSIFQSDCRLAAMDSA